VRHAYDARGAAVKTLEQEARLDAQVLRQRRDVVGREQEAGRGDAVDSTPRESGVRKRGASRLVEKALHALGRLLRVLRLAGADDPHAFEDARHVR
jgi:hypothetical protein